MTRLPKNYKLIITLFSYPFFCLISINIDSDYRKMNFSETNSEYHTVFIFKLAWSYTSTPPLRLHDVVIS